MPRQPDPKMCNLKAQLIGMFSGKSQSPHDSPYLPDSATYGKRTYFSARKLSVTLVDLLPHEVKRKWARRLIRMLKAFRQSRTRVSREVSHLARPAALVRD